MDSQSEEETLQQQASSSGISFSGFTFRKKGSQSRVKLESGANLSGETSRISEGGQGDAGGKDYVLSLEGRAIHRLVGVVAANFLPFCSISRQRQNIIIAHPIP